MEAPAIQKDTSQESKQALLSRDKPEGFVSTWALTNKRGEKCVLCIPTLPHLESLPVEGCLCVGC